MDELAGDLADEPAGGLADEPHGTDPVIGDLDLSSVSSSLARAFLLSTAGVRDGVREPRQDRAFEFAENAGLGGVHGENAEQAVLGVGRQRDHGVVPAAERRLSPLAERRVVEQFVDHHRFARPRGGHRRRPVVLVGGRRERDPVRIPVLGTRPLRRTDLVAGVVLLPDPRQPVRSHVGEVSADDVRYLGPARRADERLPDVADGVVDTSQAFRRRLPLGERRLAVVDPLFAIGPRARRWCSR